MLLKNVHRLCLDNPPEGSEGSISSVIGQYEYWHYLCDSFDDRGWGCGSGLGTGNGELMFSINMRLQENF